MKFYKLMGDLYQIEDSRWAVLKRIEPTAKEISYEEYKACMGIGQAGAESALASDETGAVGEGEKESAQSSVQAQTRKEIYNALRERGFKSTELRGKTKAELKNLL